MKPMSEEHFAVLRRHMVEVIAIHADLSGEELGKSALDERVLAAMQQVPRHRFVPDAVAPYAYQDMPLPIGFDKTISQPFIVALMTDLLDPQAHESVLEIGTGLGYQAAILAELAAQVWSVEVIEEFARQAEATLRHIGRTNVAVHIGDCDVVVEAALNMRVFNAPGYKEAMEQLTLVAFVIFFLICRSHVPSQDPLMINLWAAFTSACMTGVFWMSLHCFKFTLRAQREANAELLGAKPHDVRHDTVDPDRGEAQRDHREHEKDVGSQQCEVAPRVSALDEERDLGAEGLRGRGQAGGEVRGGIRGGGPQEARGDQHAQQ